MDDNLYRTLKLYPKGDSRADGELSQHLHLTDNDTLLKGEMILVRVSLKVLDPHGSNHLTCCRKSKTIGVTYLAMFIVSADEWDNLDAVDIFYRRA